MRKQQQGRERARAREGEGERERVTERRENINHIIVISGAGVNTGAHWDVSAPSPLSLSNELILK